MLMLDRSNFNIYVLILLSIHIYQVNAMVVGSITVRGIITGTKLIIFISCDCRITMLNSALGN